MRDKRFMLAFGLEDFEPGDEFKKWPKHITVIPWFNSARKRVLTEGLQELAEQTQPIAVRLGESAMFGVRGDVPVRLVESNDRLSQFHVDVLRIVSEARADFEDLDDLGYKYRPHVTSPEGEPLQQGYILSSLALVQDMGQLRRRVDEVFELHG